MNVNSEIAINRTYSLTMLQIAKVSQLSAELGENQSEVVRRAIDLLFEKTETEKAHIGLSEDSTR